jgi:hypothetical protein
MSNSNKELSTDTGIAADANAAVVIDTTADSAGLPMAVTTEVTTDSFADVASEHRLAEFVNPTDYEDYWRNHFYGTLYYASGCVWKDYRPAYRLGYDAYFSNHGRRFDEVESEIARSWEAIRDDSHLTWSQAKHAVRDGWQFVESAVSGSSPNRSIQ